MAARSLTGQDRKGVRNLTGRAEKEVCLSISRDDGYRPELRHLPLELGPNMGQATLTRTALVRARVVLENFSILLALVANEISRA